MTFCKNGPMRIWPISFFLLVMLLTACSSSSVAPSPTVTRRPTQMAQATQVATTTAPGPRNCQPASPMDNAPPPVELPEVHGAATNAELWALLFAPLLAKQDIKIVWKMTGSGPFHIVALGPQGLKVPPTDGPQPHLGSNWDRPGDEWGTGFTFPEPGCWDLHATRDGSFGDVWLVVE